MNFQMSLEIKFAFKKEPLPAIIGWGSFSAHKLSNDALIARHHLDSNSATIVKLTGIEERGIEDDPDITTSRIGSHAGREALKKAGLDPSRIDRIIFATTTPDYPIPATGPLAQGQLHANHAAASDLNAACSGFIFALENGYALVESHRAKKVLIIGAEKFSPVTDTTDRNSCTIFADGGGAVLIGLEDWAPQHLPSPVFDLHSDPENFRNLYVKAGGSHFPVTPEAIRNNEHKLYMKGHPIFKFAVRKMAKSVDDVLKKAKLTKEDISLIIPHQANLRIIEAVADETGVSMEQVFTNVQREGNTSSASIPKALDEAVRAGRIRAGDLILFTAFGAGFTWGSAILEWTGEIPHRESWLKNALNKTANIAEGVRNRLFWLPFPRALTEVPIPVCETMPIQD